MKSLSRPLLTGAALCAPAGAFAASASPLHGSGLTRSLADDPTGRLDPLDWASTQRETQR